ncbi:MAG: hypothetical protein WKG07_16475, partial [Hymenobacter sp.]
HVLRTIYVLLPRRRPPALPRSNHACRRTNRAPARRPSPASGPTPASYAGSTGTPSTWCRGGSGGRSGSPREGVVGTVATAGVRWVVRPKLPADALYRLIDPDFTPAGATPAGTWADRLGDLLADRLTTLLAARTAGVRADTPNAAGLDFRFYHLPVSFTPTPCVIKDSSSPSPSSLTALCAYFLFFTYVSRGVQHKAVAYATHNGKLNETQRQHYLDSVWRAPCSAPTPTAK